MLSIVLMLIAFGICVIMLSHENESVGIVAICIGIAMMVFFSCVFYSKQFTTIIDDKPDIIRGPKGSVNGVIVAVSSTEKGCVTAASNDIKWHYIPNSNIIIQANAGYNIWGKAGTNRYEIAVK